jgi:hypothetical protein
MSDQGEKPVNYRPLRVALVEEASVALDELMLATGFNEATITNRALQVYWLIEQATADPRRGGEGKTLILRDPSTGDAEIVTIKNGDEPRPTAPRHPIGFRPPARRGLPGALRRLIGR